MVTICFLNNVSDEGLPPSERVAHTAPSLGGECPYYKCDSFGVNAHVPFAG